MPKYVRIPLGYEGLPESWFSFRDGMESWIPAENYIAKKGGYLTEFENTIEGKKIGHG